MQNIIKNSKIDSNFLINYILDFTEKIAKKFYFGVLVKQEISAPSLKCKVSISRTGWEHVFERRRLLRKSERLFRFFALPKIIPLLQNKKIKAKYGLGRDQKNKVEFWSFFDTVDDVRVKVVLRSINKGPKHLFSVVWKGEVSQTKKEFSRACIPRFRGVVTPELLQKHYSKFAQNLSRFLPVDKES